VRAWRLGGNRSCLWRIGSRRRAWSRPHLRWIGLTTKPSLLGCIGVEHLAIRHLWRKVFLLAQLPPLRAFLLLRIEAAWRVLRRRWIGRCRDHGDKHAGSKTHKLLSPDPGGSLPQPWRERNRISVAYSCHRSCKPSECGNTCPASELQRAGGRRPIVSAHPTRMASRSACDLVVAGEFHFVAVRHADELKRRTSVCAGAADRPQPAV
jgi:hypothetical protein